MRPSSFATAAAPLLLAVACSLLGGVGAYTDPNEGARLLLRRSSLHRKHAHHCMLLTPL